MDVDIDAEDGVTMIDYIWLSSFCLGIVLFAGLMSGLTVGMLSIDTLALELKMRNGTDYERKAAAKLLPVISNHHLLMVSLLLANAAAMEALPIFVHMMLNELQSVIASAIAILFLGEIIPMSITTGPNQIAIDSKCLCIV